MGGSGFPRVLRRPVRALCLVLPVGVLWWVGTGNVLEERFRCRLAAAPVPGRRAGPAPPASRNGAPLLVEAYRRAQELEEKIEAEEGEFRGLSFRPWEDDEEKARIASTRRHFPRFAPCLLLIERAAGRPRIVFPPEEQFPSSAKPLEGPRQPTGYRCMTEVAGWLALRAWFRPESANRSARTLLDLAGAWEPRCLLDVLVRIGLQRRVMEILDRAAKAGVTPDPALAGRMRKQAERAATLADLRRVLPRDRRKTVALYERWRRRGDALFRGRDRILKVLFEGWPPRRPWWMRWYARPWYYRRMLALLDACDWVAVRLADPAAVRRGIAELRAVDGGDPPPRGWSREVKPWLASAQLAVAVPRLAALALTLRARLRAGKPLPAGLREIGKTSAITDPYTGDPFRYAVRDGRVVLAAAAPGTPEGLRDRGLRYEIPLRSR